MDRSRFVLAALASLAPAWLATAPCLSATIRVPADQPTLRAAFVASAIGDSILVAPGTYTGPDNKNLSWYGDQVLLSEAGPAVTIIDCENNGRFLNIDYGASPSSIIQGFTMRRGGSGFASMIHIQVASPTFRECVFEDNGLAGSTIGCIEANPTFTGCAFRRNFYSIFFAESHVTLLGCLVEDHAQHGAIEADVGSSLTVIGCLFRNNSRTSGIGSAIVASNNADVLLYHCTLVGNQSGAVYSVANCEIRQCTFYGNLQGNPGVGNSVTCAGQAFIDRCIFAGGTGRAISSGAGCVIGCTDIYGNSGGDWVGCATGQLGVSGNVSADPMFCDASLGDFRLAASSPCAAANSNGCGLIGAHDVNCGVVGVEPVTWGHIKSMWGPSRSGPVPER